MPMSKNTAVSIISRINIRRPVKIFKNFIDLYYHRGYTMKIFFSNKMYFIGWNSEKNSELATKRVGK